jgi:hypothetical protein
LERYVVRRGAVEVLVASADDQQVAVLHSRIEMNVFVAQLLLEKADEDVGLFCSDMSCGVVLDDVTFNADDVTPHRHIARFQVDTNIGSLENAPSLINLREVVGEDGEVRHFAAGMKAIGNSLESPVTSLLGKQIHIRCMGMLQ